MQSLRPRHRLIFLCALAAGVASCEPTVTEADTSKPVPDVIGFVDVPIVIPDVPAVPDVPVTPDANDGADAADTADTTPDVSTPDVPKVDAPCVPDCNGRLCGPDGCGSLCGFCSHPLVCNEFGQCVSICQTQCDGKTCGPDGCGGLCGECTSELVCGEVDQLCHEPDCIPDCVGKVCGTDGCGSTCGDCASPKICDLGACLLGPCGTVTAQGECQGNTAVFCENFTKLNETDCSQAPNHACKYNPNSEKYECLDKGVCQPSCDGKLCGDDGCGGICPPGCATGWSCAAGVCQPEPGANCGSITKAGECKGNTLWFCSTGKLNSLDCTQTGEKCKWDQSVLAFECL
jgi:hypothetical protein